MRQYDVILSLSHILILSRSTYSCPSWLLLIYFITDVEPLPHVRPLCVSLVSKTKYKANTKIHHTPLSEHPLSACPLAPSPVPLCHWPALPLLSHILPTSCALYTKCFATLPLMCVTICESSLHVHCLKIWGELVNSYSLLILPLSFL